MTLPPEIAAEDAAGPRARGGEVAYERRADALDVRLEGDWLLGDRLVASDELERRLAEPGLRRLTLDGSAIGQWDSSLLAFLVRVEKRCRAGGIEVGREGLPEGVAELLELAFAVPEQTDAGRAQGLPPPLERLGRATLDLLGGAREVLEFMGLCIQSLGRFVTGRARYRRSDVWLFVQQSGPDAVPIVSLISFLVGLILAFVGVQQLAMFGAEIYVANLVGVAMAREMGCIMTGIIMAGRTGAAFAAQLGTMTVNEEIDALTTLGISPMDFLVLPRMLALILMMPLLCLYADAVGIAGGAIIGVASSDLTIAQYFQQTVDSLSLKQVAIGVVKGTVFGVLVAIAGCLRGMQSGRSASAVGAAATSAVVLGIVWIIATDAVFAVVLDVLGL